MAKLKTKLLAGLAGLALLGSFGCEEEQPEPATMPWDAAIAFTDVIPEQGDYNWADSVWGESRSSRFSVSGSEEGRYLEGRRYLTPVPVYRGAFLHRHGVSNPSRVSDDGTMYPTDGFWMAGHFTTPTSAVGIVYYNHEYAQDHEPLHEFTANKIQQ